MTMAFKQFQFETTGSHTGILLLFLSPFYVYSWRILDVSVAMAYALLSNYGKTKGSFSAAAAVLRGYNSVNPLPDVERQHLVLLMACRLACSVTLGAYSIQQNPENEYLLLHSQPAWKALERIWPYDQQRRMDLAHAVGRLFDQACMYSDSGEENIACYDLVLPDPDVADLLQSLRVSSLGSPRMRQNEIDGCLTITVVTGNAKKLEEVQRIMGMHRLPEVVDSSRRYRLTSRKVDLPELQGEPVEVAKAKCAAAVMEVGGAVVVEDTSLCFNALNGLPGVYIKWFLEKCGHDGLNKMLASFEDKTAYAQTVVAFCPGPGKDVSVFDGRTNGKIVPARGKLDFGWDPVFEPDEGEGKTYAEMSKEGKDLISHRNRAFVQLREYLNQVSHNVVADIG
jgi:inosine triphosphate pyrophosphatase